MTFYNTVQHQDDISENSYIHNPYASNVHGINLHNYYFKLKKIIDIRNTSIFAYPYYGLYYNSIKLTNPVFVYGRVENSVAHGYKYI